MTTAATLTADAEVAAPDAIPGRWTWFALVMALGVLATIAGLYANRFGADLTTDSGVYFCAGIRLAHGQGVSYPNFIGPPSPMSLFPPAYPALIAVFELMHLPLALAVGVCNAFFWGLLVVAVGDVVWRATGHCGPIALFAAAAILSSDAIYGVHSMAMSEPLCLLLALASLVAIAWAERTGRLVAAAAAGALVAAAILTRYAAAPLLGVGALALFFGLPLRLVQRAGRMGLFLLLACGPVGFWMGIHRAPGDAPGQRSLSFHPLSPAKIREAVDTLASFVLPQNLSWRPAAHVVLVAFLLVSLALLGAAMIRHPLGPLRLWRLFGRLPAVVRAAVLFLALYPPFPVVSILFTDSNIPLDSRILSMLVPPGVIVLSYLLYRVAWRDGIVWRQCALVALATPWIGWHALEALADVRQRTDESVLVWSEHRPSPALDALAALPADAVIFTNHQRLAYWLKRRATEDLPTLPANEHSESAADSLDAELEVVHDALAHGGWVVYLYGHNLEGLDDPCLSEQQVREHFAIAEERDVADGVLLRIADPDAKPSPPDAIALGEWRLEQTGQARGEMQKEADAVQFDVIAIDATPWHVQASIPGIDLADGQAYALTFTAKASDDRKIEVVAGIDQGDYHSIGLDEDVELGEDWNDYAFTFTAAHPAPEANVLSFVLGNEKGQVWIKDVKIVARTPKKENP